MRMRLTEAINCTYAINADCKLRCSLELCLLFLLHFTSNVFSDVKAKPKFLPRPLTKCMSKCDQFLWMWMQILWTDTKISASAHFCH